MAYRRTQFQALRDRLQERRRFIQVLTGPRQTGKTTLARQVEHAAGVPVLFMSGDDPEANGRSWLQQQWERARFQARDAGKTGSALIVDEIQKLPAWSEVVKKLWDEDTASRTPLKILLLGSAPLLLQQGLTESLAGRFEVVRSPHWSYAEMHEAFGWSLDRYLYFGGYPGSADLVADEDRWKRYILDAMVETTLSRDVLQLQRVDKPALLRRLFQTAVDYSGQILSYTKMLGQLQDVGNTTTLAHYLDLLGAAGMVVGLQKYAGQKARQRGSSPKLQVLNTALISCQSELGFQETKNNPIRWGRLVESAVGAHLCNEGSLKGMSVSYWRDGQNEVDFVVQRGKELSAIEVKTGAGAVSRRGTDVFSSLFRPKRVLLVGTDGIPLKEFLGKPIERWLV